MTGRGVGLRMLIIGLLIGLGVAGVIGNLGGGSDDDTAQTAPTAPTAPTASSSTSRSTIETTVTAPSSTATSTVETASSGPSTPTEIGLVDALVQGRLSMRVDSTGSASGAALLLTVRRLVPEDLTVTVETGFVIENDTAGEQDMVLSAILGEALGTSSYTPSSQIVLTDDAEHVYVAEAYCLEAHADNPSVGTVMRLGPTADARVVAVLDAMGSVEPAPELRAQQAAVWAVTDDISRDELSEIGYDLDEAALAEVRRILEAAGLDPTTFRVTA